MAGLFLYPPFSPAPHYLSKERSIEMSSMTKEKKKEYNRTFWKRKRSEGWRFFGFVLPPVVADRVQEFKRREMAKYRGKQVEG
jgi:hypothetical protein